jgi:aminoglycoside phosphotransferase (APT) family kinase protein
MAFELSDVPSVLARGLPAKAQLSFPAQGMTSHVAFVDPGEVVLKRCTDPLYTSWLRRERDVLEALAGTPLPVPRVLGYADRGSEVWLVMTRLPGEPCASVMQRAEVDARHRLLHAIGVALRSLHATHVPLALRDETPWLRRKLAAAHQHLGWCDGNAELLARLRATPPVATRPTLMHGDLNLENVLVHEEVVTGLVDWAGGDEGDPRCDVALALQDDEVLAFDEPALAAFFAGYGHEVDAATRGWFQDLYEFF